MFVAVNVAIAFFVDRLNLSNLKLNISQFQFRFELSLASSAQACFVLINSSIKIFGYRKSSSVTFENWVPPKNFNFFLLKTSSRKRNSAISYISLGGQILATPMGNRVNSNINATKKLKIILIDFDTIVINLCTLYN